MVEAVKLGTGLSYGHRTFESPLGEVAVYFGLDGVVGVELAGSPRRGTVWADPPRRWIGLIEKALARGRPGDLPLDLSALTQFQQTALRATANIPYGEVRPYAWVARESGHPNAVRAVGSAMASNPVPLIVPCHRVVRSDGRLGDYSLGGPDNKTRLLEAEGLDLKELATLTEGGVRLTGSDTTKIYCHPSCRAARRTTARHQVDFSDRKEAEAAGYRACRLCRP